MLSILTTKDVCLGIILVGTRKVGIETAKLEQSSSNKIEQVFIFSCIVTSFLNVHHLLETFLFLATLAKPYIFDGAFNYYGVQCLMF